MTEEEFWEWAEDCPEDFPRIVLAMVDDIKRWEKDLNNIRNINLIRVLNEMKESIKEYAF